MEIGLAVLLVLFERNRPDLLLRRAWARLPVPRPALPVRVPVPVALAGTDLRRWALRLTTLLVGVWLWVLLVRERPAGAYDGVNHLVGFYLGFIGLGVLAVVAAMAGRDRGDELLAALPGGPRSRVLGWATLLLALALTEYVLLLVSRFGRDEPAYADLLPDAWQLAQGPLMLLGGGLLGLLLARLLPAWVAAPVGVFLGIAWVVVVSTDAAGVPMLGPLVEWIQYHEDGRVVVEPGSLGWHNGFLLGLCGLGLVAALLREPGRRRGLAATGSVLLAGTVAAGLLALP